jgi:hypothetical protein
MSKRDYFHLTHGVKKNRNLQKSSSINCGMIGVTRGFLKGRDSVDRKEKRRRKKKGWQVGEKR